MQTSSWTIFPLSPSILFLSVTLFSFQFALNSLSIFYEKLSWQQHLNETFIKAKITFGPMKFLSYYK